MFFFCFWFYETLGKTKDGKWKFGRQELWFVSHLYTSLLAGCGLPCGSDLLYGPVHNIYNWKRSIFAFSFLESFWHDTATFWKRRSFCCYSSIQHTVFSGVSRKFHLSGHFQKGRICVNEPPIHNEMFSLEMVAVWTGLLCIADCKTSRLNVPRER